MVNTLPSVLRRRSFEKSRLNWTAAGAPQRAGFCVLAPSSVGQRQDVWIRGRAQVPCQHPKWMSAPQCQSAWHRDIWPNEGPRGVLRMTLPWARRSLNAPFHFDWDRILKSFSACRRSIPLTDRRRCWTSAACTGGDARLPTPSRSDIVKQSQRATLAEATKST